MVTAHRVNRGLMPELTRDPAGDFHFAAYIDPEDGVEKILRLVSERTRRASASIRCATCKSSVPYPRRARRPRAQHGAAAGAAPARRAPGRALRQDVRGGRQENDDGKEVYTGDLGFIARIDPEQSEVAVDFEGREVAYDAGELDELVPAYATTVHKAQGSEYPAIVIPLVTQHWGMLRRNLVDTAVTRGKKLVVIVGQPKALAIAANRLRRRSVPRCTRRVAPSALSHAASPRPARRAGGCGPPHPPSIR